MQDTAIIKKNDKGKIITAEIAYSPFSNDGFTYDGKPIKEAKYSSKSIKQLLTNHEKNGSKLREMSDYIYNVNGMYSTLIDKCKNLVSYEHMIVPLIFNNSEINEKTYKSKFNKIRQYIWKCNFDITLEDMLFKLLKYGRYSAFDRGTYLQPLPLDYTRIIGMSSDGNPIIQFNFAYFDEFQNRELELQFNGFDPFFRVMYMKYKRGVDNAKENFVGELNWRTLPPTKTYTLKIGSNLESREGLGLFYSSIDDILFYDEVRELDRIVIGSQKRKIIVQQLPVDDEGNSILGEEEITQAHENLKKLVPPNVGVLTVLGGTKFEDIPLQLSALEKGKMAEAKDDILTSSGIGEGVLRGGNFSASVLNVDTITNTLVSIFRQIENLWFNRKFAEVVGNGQYQFKLKFLGMTAFNREKIIDAFDGLLDKGGNLSASINARGFNTVEYIDLLEIEDALGYKDHFKPLQTSFTMSGKDSGRPQDNSTGGNDNTTKSKDNGSNNNPKPSK